MCVDDDNQYAHEGLYWRRLSRLSPHAAHSHECFGARIMHDHTTLFKAADHVLRE